MGLIAEITRLHKTSARGASAALLIPVFRILAMLGALRWLIGHQHLVTTFVTNLRGPGAPVSFLGTAVSEVIPLNAVTGNVAVAFAALSYAGTLTITVTADGRSRSVLTSTAPQLIIRNTTGPPRDR